ncbi:MAG: VWA domain-containing protein [Anaerolineae bacterium]|nr:VWA domain-containing protein [Anaerolineae bacterium]
MRRITLWLLLFWVIVGGVAAQPPNEIPITIDLTAEPRTGDAAVAAPGLDTLVVRVELTGSNCPVILQRQVPVDVVLVIDISDSMSESVGDNSGLNKIEALQRAALSFTPNFNLNAADPVNSDQIGIVVFDTNAQVLVPLSRDRNTLNSAINNLSLGSGTNIADGLREATDMLAGAEANSENGALPVIILLSDGVDGNPAAVEAEADRARRITEARIVTIAFGQNADVSTLQAIASNPDSDNFFPVVDASALDQLYQDLSRNIQIQTVAEDLTITFNLNPNFVIDPTSITQNGRLIGPSSAPNGIEWNYTRITVGQTATFRFEVQALTPGSQDVGTVSINMLACENPSPVEISQTGPNILLLEPTATPTPIATSTPTPTPTATATATATENAVLRPFPTSDPQMIAQTTPGTAGSLCPPGWWDWLPLLIALIALILALLWIYDGWRNRPNNPTWRDWLCLLLRTLAGLVGVYTLYLLVSPIPGAICTQPESVYFWRMADSGSGIFITNSDNRSNIPVEVLNLNQNDCVGCHFVNSEAGLIGGIIGPIPGDWRVQRFDGTEISLPSTAQYGSPIYAAFSPDGTQIAATTESGELLVINLQNGIVRPVNGATDAQFGAVMPAWTADGAQIGFVRAERRNINVGLIITGESGIYRVPVQGGQAQPILGAVENGLNYYPTFSPDGRWLSFTRASSGTSYANPNAEVMLLDLTASSPTAIRVSTPGAESSWSSWNRQSNQLAYNTRQFDSSYDIVIAAIDPNGAISQPIPLAGASEPGVFEHLPFWGLPNSRIDLVAAWVNVLPWILLTAILFALSFACIYFHRGEVPKETIQPQPPRRPLDPTPLEVKPFQPLWTPRHALVIGLGRAGWHVARELKQTLYNAGVGQISPNVQLLSIVAGDKESLAGQRDAAAIGRPLDETSEMFRWTDALYDTAINADRDAALKGWIDVASVKRQGANALNSESGFQGNRAYARLALIDNLRRYDETDQRSLAKQLIDKARAASNNQPLTVVIVADLSDDVGSGNAIDLAYLSRRLDKVIGQGKVRVIGHFLTDRALHTSSGEIQARLNAAAALRELERAQSGASFHAVYSTNPQKPTVFDGIVDQRLFDELYLYDGSNTLLGLAPDVGIFPMLADSIALQLDEAASKNQLDAWRNRMIGTQNALVQNDGAELFSSLGIFQYRLPMGELLEGLSIRFARELLQKLLMGVSTEKPRHDPTLSQEIYFPNQTPEILTHAFFKGQFGTPRGMSAPLENLLLGVGQNKTDLVRTALREQLTVDHVNQQMSKDVEAWRAWLTQMLLILLNGQATDNPDPVLTRGAKLSLAIAFIEALLNENSGRLAMVEQAVKSGNVGADHPLYTLLRQLRDVAQKLGEQLWDTGQSLAWGKESVTLLGMLKRYEATSIRQWEDLATRRYVTTVRIDGKDQRLFDLWYERFFFPYIEEALAALYWSPYANDLLLTLKFVGRTPTLTDHELLSFEEFIVELKHMALYFADQKGKFRENVSLDQVLRGSRLHEDNRENTLREMWQNAAPALGIDPARAANATEGMILSAHEGISNAAVLEAAAKGLLVNQNNFFRLKATDPASFTLVHTLDTLPSNSIPSVEGARELYRNRIASDRYLASAFGAEWIALGYERRMGEINRAVEPLHPRVVTALGSFETLRAYLLITLVNQEVRSSQADMMTLKTPEVGTLIWPTTTPQGALMEGLARFQTEVTPEAAQAVFERYNKDDTILERLSQWELGRIETVGNRLWDVRFIPDQRLASELYSDLQAVARLMIRDLLE